MITFRRTRVSRRDFYRWGGLSQPDLYRKGTSSGWSYWRNLW